MSMPKRPGGLGKGLGALIDGQKYENKQPSQSSLNEIEISQIELNPYQPRTEFDEESLNELSASIQKLGIIQPITVRRLQKDKYQLISGERRLRASKMAGLTAVPAFVREADDQEMLEFALVENIQREDLNAIEIAISYQRLIDECKLTHEVMSERVGKKRSTITNYLRLLKLPVELQAGLRDQKISMGHARAIINVENVDTQLEIFERIVKEELSVRATEDLVRMLSRPVEEPKEKPTLNLPEKFRDFESYLRGTLGQKIQVNRDPSGKGKIVIAFKSDDEFSKLVEKFEKLSH